ncbi:M28 family metallopeptidase [Chryseolinea lacunae]|uniref:M28 family peptidase n=1 Tax=Chryseolinea lacunae TaxID=2801331 RepID=A0ABS1KPT0_9BACT|nr:M28 family peptidase [Chryseolinea lacunae]MBL0741431.1 M28 family peptidase [Chryseolinea lacunae]
MTHLDLIKSLDNKMNYERLDIIIDRLESLDVPYRKETYATGTNLIVDLGKGTKRLAIASHFDRVVDTAGANDNGSAIAVCLAIIERHIRRPEAEWPLRVFFFDEEETGLKGSGAYVKTHGVADLLGVLNMELVGKGDQFALWPVTNTRVGKLLETFEAVAQRDDIATARFDQIVTNMADHVPFRKAGLEDVFTITCISEQDKKVAEHYYKALAFDVSGDTLTEILSGAPIFEHYHKPTDTYDRLSEKAIEMSATTVWKTLVGCAQALYV